MKKKYRFSKYWKIIERLFLNQLVFEFDYHEEKFVKSMFNNLDPYASEPELTDAQKDWILKLDKKYPKEDL